VVGEEVLFRAWAVGSDGVNKTAKDILFRKVLSESGRKHKPYKSLRDGTIPVNLISKGISRPGALSTIDQSVASGFLKCVTRGLIYHLYPTWWTPVLYFWVKQLNGPQPNQQARRLVAKYEHLLIRFDKGSTFASLHHVSGTTERWISLWAYMFYERVEFAVLCTTECRADFLD